MLGPQTDRFTHDKTRPSLSPPLIRPAITTENLVIGGVQLHKTQLASDRTSCRSAVANQVRLVLHTGAYWLMLAVREAIPKTGDLAKAEFATLRQRLIKIAARVMETARTVRLAFAACHPEATLFASLPAALAALGP